MGLKVGQSPPMAAHYGNRCVGFSLPSVSFPLLHRFYDSQTTLTGRNANSMIAMLCASLRWMGLVSSCFKHTADGPTVDEPKATSPQGPRSALATVVVCIPNRNSTDPEECVTHSQKRCLCALCDGLGDLCVLIKPPKRPGSMSRRPFWHRRLNTSSVPPCLCG